MKIETKFNTGDHIYFLKNNKVQQAEVLRIKINVSHLKDVEIIYITGGDQVINENGAFNTKKELLESL